MSSGAPWCQHLCRFSDVPPRSLMSCRSFHDPCHERPVWLCRAGDCRSTCAPPSPRRSWSSDGTSGARMASLLQRLGEHLLDLLISNGARPPRPPAAARPTAPPTDRPETASATSTPFRETTPVPAPPQRWSRPQHTPTRSAPATPTPAPSSAAAPTPPAPNVPRRTTPLDQASGSASPESTEYP